MADEFYESIRKQIEVHFSTQWASVGGGVPCRYPNVPFEQPSTGIWIWLNILTADGSQGSIGSTIMERQPGFIIVQCFCKPGEGSKVAMELADKVATALRYRALTDGTVRVSTRAASLSPASQQPDNAQWNVSVEFEARRTIIRQ